MHRLSAGSVLSVGLGSHAKFALCLLLPIPRPRKTRRCLQGAIYMWSSLFGAPAPAEAAEEEEEALHSPTESSHTRSDGETVTDDGDSLDASSISSSSQEGTRAEQEAAAKSLAAAEAASAAGNDVLARKLVEQSLASGCKLPAAQKLLNHLTKFGPGSAALAAVTKVLRANDACAILGVSSDASPTRLKKAYKRACLELHPDRCHAAGAEEAFKKVQEAFANLDPNAPKAKKISKRRHAEQEQRERDRGWTSRGVDPRSGAPATRGRKPTHLDPPVKRANGKTAYKPKAGPPPSPPRASTPSKATPSKASGGGGTSARSGSSRKAATAAAAHSSAWATPPKANGPMGPLEA